MQLLEDDEVKTYYREILSTYFDEVPVKVNKELKKKVIDRTVEDFYYNYGFTEGLYQYWLKYYYPTCLNFTSFLAIYSGEELPFTVFENTTNTALNKLTHFIEEQSIEMIRNEMSIYSELSEDYDLDIKFIWRITHDRKVCDVCRRLDGKVYKYVPNLAHPNCRCKLEVFLDENNRLYY